MMDFLYGIAHLDGATLAVLLLAVALAAAMLGILPAWRRVWSENARLPVRRFLHRRGTQLVRREALEAELRCGLCASKATCNRLLAAGAKAPLAGCPNARLLMR